MLVYQRVESIPPWPPSPGPRSPLPAASWAAAPGCRAPPKTAARGARREDRAVARAGPGE